MNDTIDTPEALDALLAVAGERAEPVVLREGGFRVWTLTEDERGDWWAWSWREEGEDGNPRPVGTLQLPLTVLFRPDAPTPTPADEGRAATDEAARLYAWDAADDSTITALRSAFRAGADFASRPSAGGVR